MSFLTNLLLSMITTIASFHQMAHIGFNTPDCRCKQQFDYAPSLQRPMPRRGRVIYRDDDIERRLISGADKLLILG